jgi:hypothetical protein
MERQVVLLPTSFLWRAVAAALACAFVCSVGRAARADEHPPIVLVLDSCADVDANEVRRLMPIEMGAPVATGGPVAPDTTRVSVGCVVDSPHLVRLEVRDAVTGKTLDRLITLAGVARSDRGRLVAISAVELVAASRSPAREPEVAVVVPAPVAAPVPAIVAAPAPREDATPARWRVLAVGGLRGFAGLPRLLPGGGLAVQRAFGRVLAANADVMVEGGAQPTSLGDVSALVASAGLVASLRADTGRVRWEPGLGVRGGFARLEGQARADTVGGTVTARWGGPMAALRATVALGRRFVLALGGEVGYVTAGVAGHVVNADGQPGKPDVAINGAWWSATLGVGFGR